MSNMEMKIQSIIGVLQNDAYVVLDKIFDNGDFKGATGSEFRPISERERQERMSIENAMDYFEDVWAEIYSNKPGFDAANNRYEDGNEEGGFEEEFPSLYTFARNSLDDMGDEAIFDLSYYDVGCKVAEFHNERLAKDKGLTLEQFKSQFPYEACEISECTGGGRCFFYKMNWVEIFDKRALKMALSCEVPGVYDNGWEELLSKHLNRADIEGIKSRIKKAVA